MLSASSLKDLNEEDKKRETEEKHDNITSSSSSDLNATSNINPNRINNIASIDENINDIDEEHDEASAVAAVLLSTAPPPPLVYSPQQTYTQVSPKRNIDNIKYESIKSNSSPTLNTHTLTSQHDRRHSVNLAGVSLPSITVPNPLESSISSPPSPPKLSNEEFVPTTTMIPLKVSPLSSIESSLEDGVVVDNNHDTPSNVLMKKVHAFDLDSHSQNQTPSSRRHSTVSIGTDFAVESAQPFLYKPSSKVVRYTNWRWNLFLPLYSRPNIYYLRTFTYIELILVIIFFAVHAGIVIPAIINIATGTGSSTTTNHGGDTTTQVAQNTYDAAASLGSIGSIDVLLLWFPVTRNSIWSPLLGISYDRAIQYHKWIARMAVAVLIVHGAGIDASYWYQNDFNSQALDGPVSVNGSGEISLIAGICLIIFSIDLIRVYMFEAFLRLHWIFFVIFLIFGIIHETTFLGIVVVGLILWVIDWYYRIQVMKHHVTVLNIQALPANVVRIEFLKDNFKYEAGQWVLICIPAISLFEWHPFSLSTSPHHSTIMVHCRVLGDWTKKLQRVAVEPASTPPVCYVEGSYGNLSIPLERFSAITLISGGIGITPLQSVYNSLIFEYLRGIRNLTIVNFVWTVREVELVRSLYDAPLVQPDTSKPMLLPPFFSPDMLAYHNARRAPRNKAKLSTNNIVTSTHDNINDPATSAMVVKERKRKNSISRIDSLEGKAVTSFFVTGAKSQTEISLLRDNYPDWIHAGRPDLVGEIMSVKNRAIKAGLTEMAVCCCGPVSLMKDVTRIVSQLSEKGMRIYLHEEIADIVLDQAN